MKMTRVYSGLTAGAVLLTVVVLCAYVGPSRTPLRKKSNLDSAPLAPNINLGRLKLGRMRFSVPLRNQDHAPLILESVAASCGCISAEDSVNVKGSVLDPGQTRDFWFNLDVSDTMRGPMKYLLAFKTKDVTKSIVGSVSFIVPWQPILTALPCRIECGNVSRDSEIAARVVLVPPLPEPLRIESIITTDPRILVCEGDLKEDEKYGLYSRTVGVTVHKGTFPGKINEAITVATSQGKLTIPVSGNVDLPIQCSPGGINWGVIHGGQPRVKELTLRSREGVPFKILSARADSPAIHFTNMNTDTVSRVQHSLRIENTPLRDNPAGPKDGVITIETDQGLVEVAQHCFTSEALTSTN